MDREERERLHWEYEHDPVVSGILDALSAAEAKLHDATRFCSGEFPCEASTAAASLEKELHAAERERDEAREECAKLQEHIDVEQRAPGGGECRRGAGKSTDCFPRLAWRAVELGRERRGRTGVRHGETLADCPL